MGPLGFRRYIDRNGHAPLAMHCDIVVAANADGDGKLYTVGGNVLQGVTMRTLHVNGKGELWGLPRRTTAPTVCRPDANTACSFDRQDWVALLKLEPKASAPPPTTPSCCTLCPLPMPVGMRRCPAAPPAGAGG